MSTLKLGFHVLAICGAAGFSGVMLSIGVTLGGYWRSLPAQEFLNWFAANNGFVARSVPIIVLPTLIGLVGSLWTTWTTPAFLLWVLSTVCIATVLILTVVYFVPSNTAFANGSVDPAEVEAKLNQWLQLHMFRIAIAMLAAVFGILALTRQVP